MIFDPNFVSNEWKSNTRILYFIGEFREIFILKILYDDNYVYFDFETTFDILQGVSRTDLKTTHTKKYDDDNLHLRMS